MKVLNLRCGREHRFEGWFASEDDFAVQESRAQVACPICNDTHVTRLPSAPRLNVLTSRGESKSAGAGAGPDDASARAQAQAAWLRGLRKLIDTTEDVGERFPEEARRIHYGESEQRGIRGHASPADADALREEGIEVISLVVPESAKGPLQ